MAKTTTNDVRVIEGWVQYDVIRNDFNHADEGGNVIYFQKAKELSMDEPASLVIGDKAMPMSQVEAMLRELIEELAVSKADESEALTIAAKYGVKLS